MVHLSHPIKSTNKILFKFMDEFDIISVSYQNLPSTKVLRLFDVACGLNYVTHLSLLLQEGA